MFSAAKNREKKEKGVAVLALALIAIVIVLTLGVAISFVAIIDNMNAFSQRKAAEAQVAAQAGVGDALEIILRGRSFTYDPPGYTLAVNSATATVTVANSDCVTSLPDYKCVESLGKSQNRQRKIRAVVSINPDTGKVVVVSQKEIEI